MLRGLFLKNKKKKKGGGGVKFANLRNRSQSAFTDGGRVCGVVWVLVIFTMDSTTIVNMSRDKKEAMDRW